MFTYFLLVIPTKGTKNKSKVKTKKKKKKTKE